MEQLVRREARLALRAYAGAPAEDISGVVEQAGPIIGRLLGAMHRKRLRQFLAEVGQNRRGRPLAGHRALASRAHCV